MRRLLTWRFVNGSIRNRMDGKSPRCVSPSARLSDVDPLTVSSSGSKWPTCSRPRPRWQPKPRVCTTGTPPTWQRSCGRFLSPSDGSWPRPWMTTVWPTSSRSCPNPNRSVSSKVSTWIDSSPCSTRWKSTTSPTCSPKCPVTSAPRSSTPWTKRTRTSCVASSPTKKELLVV